MEGCHTLLLILAGLIKPNVLLLKIKLHLHLGIDFLNIFLGSLNNLVSMISEAIK